MKLIVFRKVASGPEVGRVAVLPTGGLVVNEFRHVNGQLVVEINAGTSTGFVIDMPFDKVVENLDAELERWHG